MRYKGFISYKHGADDALATSLEKALEKFAKPVFKRRALEIFRDSNDLSAAADLGEKIRTGLQESEYFICLASPTYAGSKWCCREAEFWRDHKSVDNFLIVLTEGEIKWDEAANDFDWSATTALPRELSGYFKGEPFYIDFRKAGPPETLNLDNAEFKNRLVLLAATLHQKPVGDLVSEAAVQHRRLIRIRNATIAVLSILLLAAITAGLLALRQKNKALQATYLANSQGQFDHDPTKSLRLAETAYRFANDHGFETRDAAEQLIRVFYSGNGFYQEANHEQPDFAEQEEGIPVDPDHPAYADLARITDSLLSSLPRDPYLMNQSALHVDTHSLDALFVATSTGLGYYRIYYMTRGPGSYDIEQADILISGFSGYTAYVEDIDISPDGKYTLLGAANGKSALIENEAYRRQADRNVFKNRAILKSEYEYPIRQVAFLDEGASVAIESYKTEVVNEVSQDVEQHVFYYQTTAFPYIEMVNSEDEHGNTSLDGQYYMQPVEAGLDPFTWFHFAQTVYTRDGSVLAEFPDAMAAGYDTNASPDGSYILNYQGIFNAAGQRLVTLNLDVIDNPGTAYCFSTDGKFVKVSYLDGLQRIFALDPEFILARLNNPSVMGRVARLSEEDKTRFLIGD